MASNWIISEPGDESKHEITWTIKQFSKIFRESRKSLDYLSSKSFKVHDRCSMSLDFQSNSDYFECRIWVSGPKFDGVYTLSILKAQKVVWTQPFEKPGNWMALKGVPTPLPTNFLEDDSLTLHLRISIRSIITRSFEEAHLPSARTPRLLVTNSFVNQCHNTGQYSDCVVSDQDGTEFRCHKFVLASQSKVFHTMFSAQNMQEASEARVQVTDIHTHTLAALIEYLYTGDFDRDQSEDLLVAADIYDLQPLRQACESHLIKGLTKENVVDLIRLADGHNFPGLKTAALEYFRSSNELLVDLCWDNHHLCLSNDALASRLDVLEGLNRD